MLIKNMLKNSSFVIGAAMIVCSCTNSSENTTTDIQPIIDSATTLLMQVPAVQPPIPGVNVPFDIYKVNVSEGMTFQTKTGTQVTIPADAFVDENGKPIDGTVDIKFREFHRAGDLIASGIVMHEAETGRYMETGGMFEIEGEKEGKEIYVKADKEINVDLASYNPGDDFKFWELDRKKCHWDDKGEAPTEKPNLAKKEGLAAISKSMPLKPVKPLNRANLEKGQYFELDVNFKRFPMLEPYSNVVWKYAGEGIDIEKESWVFETDWDKIDLKDSGRGSYELMLSDGEKSVSTFVQPVLAGDDYAKSLAEFNDKALVEYNKVKERLEQRRQLLNFQAEVTRNFRVNGFGVYNCDKWRSISTVTFTPEIAFDDESGLDEKNKKTVQYYMVMNNGNAVVPFVNNGTRPFRMPMNGDRAMIALLPKGKVAMYTASDFNAVNMEDVKNQIKIPINMRTAENIINTADDLSMVVDYAMLN